MSNRNVGECDHCGQFTICYEDNAGGEACEKCKRLNEEKTLAIEFSGTFFITAKDVIFQPISWIIGNMEDPVIDGEQWLKLKEEDRSKYILQSITEVARDCQDLTIESLKIVEEED